jgi:hypothetical protein
MNGWVWEWSSSGELLLLEKTRKGSLTRTIGLLYTRFKLLPLVSRSFTRNKEKWMTALGRSFSLNNLLVSSRNTSFPFHHFESFLQVFVVGFLPGFENALESVSL